MLCSSPGLSCSENPSPWGVFWLEDTADKIPKPAAILWMCQEGLGSLGAEGNRVRSAAGRSRGECVEESGNNLCRCVIFFFFFGSISLFIYTWNIFFFLFVCGPLCLVLENNEIVVCFFSSDN